MYVHTRNNAYSTSVMRGGCKNSTVVERAGQVGGLNGETTM